MENTTDIQATEPKIYSLLNIGSRGAGKTVFLASCYQESQANSLRFTYDEEESEENIHKILQYVAQTGQYPPATLKLGNFDFQIEYNPKEGKTSPGFLRWWDVPGESCQLYNLAFLTMMLNSDGCLFFLDAPELLSEEGQRKTSLSIFQTIIEIINYNKNNFLLGIIVTKCDRISRSSEDWNTLEEIVQKLEKSLQAIQVEHQIFYSQVTIDPETRTLRSNQAESVTQWLLSHLLEKQKRVSTPAKNGE
jgi:GTP-binding protein EngB required for normal cell division